MSLVSAFTVSRWSCSYYLQQKCVGMCTIRLQPPTKLPKYKTKVYSEVAGEYKLLNFEHGCQLCIHILEFS